MTDDQASQLAREEFEATFSSAEPFISEQQAWTLMKMTMRGDYPAENDRREKFGDVKSLARFLNKRAKKWIAMADALLALKSKPTSAEPGKENQPRS